LVVKRAAASAIDVARLSTIQRKSSEMKPWPISGR